MTVPGIAPIISSAIVAAIGTGDAFSKGRDFGAWLGLVHKQMSTGDRTILGSISKRGNRYLRKLFVQAAWVVLVKLGPEQWERYGLKSWIEAAKKCLHHNVLAIALANKLARIAWAVLHKGRAFECVKRCNSVPTCLILAPCSGPSRRGLETQAQAAMSSDGQPRWPLRAARRCTCRPGRRNGRQARTKEQYQARRLSMT